MPNTRTARIDVAAVRRRQVVDAAVAVIARRGLEHLSLSEIEKKAGMSRGQLTYYFPSKEDILLAVFDRHLENLCRRIGTPEAPVCFPAGGRAWVERLLERLLVQPSVSPDFHCLQYTFLAQIARREDFRRRLATLYEGWRAGLAQGLEQDGAAGRKRGASPRALATLVQAILHGLAVQRAADPEAFDPREMLALCRDLLGGYLRPARKIRRPPAKKLPSANGSPASARARSRPAKVKP